MMNEFYILVILDQMVENHLEWLLKQLPTKVDALICEGTTLSRGTYKNQTEKELENQAVRLFSKKNGPIFILMSSMNIDRIVTIYRAAKKNKRILLQELYMAEITKSIGGSIRILIPSLM